jgi:poly(A)-specific ribonuclease
MVNVTKSNFLTQLADFLHHLPTSSYVAIDEEMTGISLPSSDDGRPNKVELPAERYARCLKAVPERYSILQVGVALFHRNPNYPQVKKVKVEEEEEEVGLGLGLGLGLGRDGGEEDGEDDEHAYMHREGMLNQDELEDLTEREEEEVEEEEEEEDNGEDDDAAAAEGKEGQTEYTSRVYNFYLFPHGGGGGSRQQGREITMNPSTVKFLLENHMDFDKVFREGVPYATVEEASYLKRRYFEKYNANNRADDDNATAPAASPAAPRSGRNRVTLTRVEDIAFVARAMAGLREWIDSDSESAAAADGGDNNGGDGGAVGPDGAVGPGGDGGDASGGDVHDGTSRREEGASLVLPPCNAFLRRCLYETIEDEYPGLVLERADSASEGGGATASATARNQIRAIRLSPAEKERREARLRREAWDGVLAELGFATVFRALSDACNGRTFEEGRTRDYLDGMCPDLTCCPPATPPATGRRIPIVVHNGLHDLMFLMTHCHDPALPDSFEDTKTIIRTYFPLVFDTKVIGTEYSDAIIRGGSTILGDLFATTCGDGREPPSDGAAGVSPPIELPASITNQDGRGQGQAHEAAYDAYMTGTCDDHTRPQPLRWV